jgi:hypothetical protein
VPDQRTRYSISVGWMVGTGDRGRARAQGAQGPSPTAGAGGAPRGVGRGTAISTLTPKHGRIR